MAIVITCPSCAGRLQVPERALGKRGRCPRCGAAMLLTRPEVAPQKVNCPPPPTERSPAGPRPGPLEMDHDSPHVTREKRRSPGAEDRDQEVIAPSSLPRPSTQEEPEEVSDDAPARIPRKKKKKAAKKTRRRLHEDERAAWPWWVFGGGGVCVTMILLLALTVLTSFGNPVKWYAVYLLVFLPIGAIIFFAAMFLSSVTVGAVEIGEIHVALFKAFFLVLLVNLVRLLPLGVYFTWLVWLIGLMTLFGLDFWEARILFFFNWVLNVALNILLMGVLLSWSAGGTDRHDWERPPRNGAPAPGVEVDQD
jgi:hypothetical protein